MVSKSFLLSVVFALSSLLAFSQTVPTPATLTPTQTGGGAAVVPTLSPGMLALLGFALAGAAYLLIRRS